jgi:outer membrane protein TolC
MTSQFARHRLVFVLIGADLVPSATSAQALVRASAQAQAATIDSPSPPESPARGEDGPVLEKLTFDLAVRRALDRNPTSLQAAAEIRRYHALMEEVRAASLPTLNAAGAYTRLDANRVCGRLRPRAGELTLIGFPFYQSPPVPTIPRTGWQAELVLTIPLYDGGLRYAQEHERNALADEAQLSVEATLRPARSEARAAFEEIQRADVALDQAQQSAAFAAKALVLANLAYRGGATTNLEVIDAERQSRDADTQAAVAEDTSRQARLDLLAASGRFP